MKKLLILTLVIVVSLLGCMSTDRSGERIGRDGNIQEYRGIYSGEITTLNYLITSNAMEFGIAANLVDSLIEYDKYGRVKPALATEWKVSEDNLVWTFKIREGVKWIRYDGSEYGELTADDFVHGMRYVLDASNRSQTANIAYKVIKNGEKYYNGEIQDVESIGVRALDRYTLEYTLERPTPYFLSITSYVCFFPVNRQFLDEIGDWFGTDNTNILYNGAYIMEKFEPQNIRVLVANEKYWDRENVHIDRLVSIYNREAASLAPELFLRGEIDSATIPPAVLDEWMRDSKKKNLVRPNRTSYYSYFYALNFEPMFPEEFEPDNWKAAVNNRNFRKALFHALDREAAMLTSEPYIPKNRIHNTITPKNLIVYKGLDYIQFGSLGHIAYRDSFNEELALKYRDKSIEELDGKVKFPVKVLMPYNTGARGAAGAWGNRAQVIEQQMESLLGRDFIDIIIEPHPPTGFLQGVRKSGRYALLECNWGPDYADPETFTNPFDSTGTYNKPHLAEGYKEYNGKHRYENLLDKAKGEIFNIEKRLYLFAEAEAFLIEEAFVIPYGVGGGGYMASRLNPFEALYSPFGTGTVKYKGLKLLEKPMSIEEYSKEFKIWDAERIEALRLAR